MISSKSVLLFCLLLSGALLHAQNNDMERDGELDKKYSPDQSSIFNNLNKKNISNASHESTEIKNSIKYCPTALFRQKVLFLYEREVYEGISLQAGLGKAFGQDVIQNVFFGLQDLTITDALPAYTMISNAKYSGSTPYIYLGAKVYFSGKTFDGGYVEVSYRHERIDYDLNPEINNNYIDGSTGASFKMNAFAFGFGYTAVTGQNDNLTHDFFINFGVKYFKYTRFDKIAIQGAYGAQDVYRRSNLELSTRILPAISLGYCFGFGF